MFRTRNSAARELQGLRPFRYCTPRELEWARRKLTPVTFDAGSPLMHEGDVSTEAFVIAEGAATVIKAGQPVASAETGSVVGDLGVLTRRPRSATVTAETPLVALVASAREFNDLVDSIAPFTKQLLLDVMARRDDLRTE